MYEGIILPRRRAKFISLITGLQVDEVAIAILLNKSILKPFN
jgi:hypothetical protein